MFFTSSYFPFSGRRHVDVDDSVHAYMHMHGSWMGVDDYFELRWKEATAAGSAVGT
jgi:hypothetical protein